MLFNSYIFVFLFLPLVLSGYFVLNHFKKEIFAEYFLIGMSLWFYAYFNLSYLPIIVISVVLNFILGRAFLSDLKQKIKLPLFIFALIANVGILFYYKYMGFFVQNINAIFNTDLIVKNILLPLGISFFTFQQLSYIVDSYRGTIPKYTFRQYSLFVTFFPQLIAGPIVLHNETIPQFQDKSKKKFNWDNFAIGLMAFSRGMAKKVLIADAFGNVVNWGYGNIESLGTTNAIFVMLSYTIQIYFDFSGYCDMATGIGKMFNIDIPMNFNSPYKALTVTDFWKRWHITLTRFLRTYIYFPLGGNRKGTIRTYLNLFIVFFISGLWHGANYTFIVWGALHGLFMIFERIFKNKIVKIHPALSWLITFIFINITWIFFRSENLDTAISLIKQILKFNFTPLSNTMMATFNFDIINFILPRFSHFGSFIGRIGNYLSLNYGVYTIIIVTIGMLFFKNTNEKIDKFKFSYKNAIFNSILLFLSIISFAGISTFLYFNF